jgi:hypothetical protein
MPAVSSGNNLFVAWMMKPLERSTIPAAPYRFPSRHSSADDNIAQLTADSARDQSGTAAPRLAPPPLTTVSDIKRRQEALLIAYLVNRLAR